MFDNTDLEWPPPITPPPEDVILIDDLVEDPSGVAEPVRWSEYLPDGMLADLLAQPAQVDPEHREFEALERIGGWERVIAWAQARQAREMTSFIDSAEARNKALGAYDSQAHDSAVAEVGLMLAVSARTAACRVGDAWSLCTRLPATLAAMEAGRITLAKARIVDAETLNLSSEHTAAVEARVLAKAPKQTPGQLRAATRRAVLSADPAAARKRAEQARRERGVRMWPEPEARASTQAIMPFTSKGRQLDIRCAGPGPSGVRVSQSRVGGSVQVGPAATEVARRGDHPSTRIELLPGPAGLMAHGLDAAPPEPVDRPRPTDATQIVGYL